MKIREEQKELATYRIRTRPHRMRDALRRLSESFRNRLKRFDSTHNTDKYVRVYMCFLFVCHSHFFSFHEHKIEKQRERDGEREIFCLRIEK